MGKKGKGPSYDVYPYTDVPFIGNDDIVVGNDEIAPHFGDQMLQNHSVNCGDSGNRHIQAKQAKYENFHIKTTALISTTFCQAIKTTKYSTKYHL